MVYKDREDSVMGRYKEKEIKKNGRKKGGNSEIVCEE